MAIALHRRHFAIINTQAKCDAIIRYDNDLDQWIRFFCDNWNFFDAILSHFVCDYFLQFSILFDNFLRLEKLAQASYAEFLINTKLQNNKSNNEVLLERVNTLFFVFKIRTVCFQLKLAVFNFDFFILVLSYFFFICS